MKKLMKTNLKIIIVLLVSTISLSACALDSIITTIDTNQVTPEATEIDVSEIETQANEITQEPQSEPTEPTEEPEEVVTEIDEVIEDDAAIEVAGLTNFEVESLIFMREEEKLAHDVYLALYDIWGLPLFQNIAGSEQTHTDAIKNLLFQFEIPDPADTSPNGTFVNADLQALYDELTQLGAQSLADALKVGGAIEEIDILDLEEALEIVEDQSIRRVYENLLRGSENHLRAFTSTLERQTGEVYEPQYMNKTDYDVVVNSGNERGSRGNGRRP